jgi:hypothetical protein
MKVIVIYDTRFGNKETIVKALDTGLGKVRGVETTCMNASDRIDVNIVICRPCERLIYAN